LELHRHGRTRFIFGKAKFDEVNGEFDAVPSGRGAARRGFAL
jgi:hypothetical protein